MATLKNYPYLLTVLMLILAMLACTIPTEVIEEAAEGLAELELFVSTTGNDRNDCQTPETACRTIARTVRVANEMDNAIIRISTGTYDETDKSVIRKSMLIQGEGMVNIIHRVGDLELFIIMPEDEAATIRLENFTIEDGDLGIRAASGRLMIRDVNFNAQNTALQTYENAWVSVQNAAIRNTGGTAIAILSNSSVVSLNNVSISGRIDTAIVNRGGDLTLENVNIFDNSSRGLFPTAIFNGTDGVGGPGGTLRIKNSAIYNNRHAAGLGQPAIFNAGGIMEITNSTISGNSGDGIFVGRDSQTSLIHVTIANHPGVGLNSWGDIIRTGVTLVNTLIVYNGRDCDLRTNYDAGVTLPDVRNSMDSDNTCLETQSAERAAWDFSPGVLPLADNGGGSLTHSLERTSPAVDAVSCPLAADQRGVSRPQGERCDIGALELEAELGDPPIGPTNTPLAVVEQTTPNATLPVVATQVITATPSPMVRFLTGGNCRTGPGTVYPVVTALQQGAESPAEGRNNDNSWWYILAAPNVRCWVSATVVEAIGPVAGLPALPAPPTPIPSPTPTTVLIPSPTPTTAPVQIPTAPAQFYIQDRVCNGQTYTVTLRWLDQSNNEQGFRVYRDGTLIATLSANEVQYTDSPPYGGPYTYGVEAFNTAGASVRQTVNESGCIP